jgi:hypothetical protein
MEAGCEFVSGKLEIENGKQVLYYCLCVSGQACRRLDEQR